MSVEEESRKILAVMDSYVHAFETADADLMQSLHWVDDPNFTEIEDVINEPFGRDRFLEIMEWIRLHGRLGRKMKFYDIKVNTLSPDIAYSTAYQEIRSLKEEKVNTSRVSIIFLKKAGEWKIIHGHFSSMPK